MKYPAMPLVILLVILLSPRTPVAAEVYLGSGADLTLETGPDGAAVLPEASIAAGLDEDLLLTPVLAVFLQAGLRTQYAFSEQILSLEPSGVLDGSYRFGRWLGRLRLSGVGDFSVPWSEPYAGFAAEGEITWGGLRASLSGGPRLAVTVSPHTEAWLEASLSADLLLGTTWIVAPLLEAGVKVHADDSQPQEAWGLSPSLSVSWFPAPRITTELAAGYRRFSSSETGSVVSGGADYPIGSYERLELSADFGWIATRVFDIQAAVPLVWTWASYPATDGGTELDDDEWTLVFEPRVELGIQVSPGVFGLVTVGTYSRTSNTAPLRTFELSAGLGIDIQLD